MFIRKRPDTGEVVNVAGNEKNVALAIPRPLLSDDANIKHENAPRWENVLTGSLGGRSGSLNVRSGKTPKKNRPFLRVKRPVWRLILGCGRNFFDQPGEDPRVGEKNLAQPLQSMISGRWQGDLVRKAALKAPENGNSAPEPGHRTP
jgi:hypothetical protein